MRCAWGREDYLSKPFDVHDVRLSLERALERTALRRELSQLRQELSRRYGFGSLIGKTERMKQVFSMVERVADRRVTVLLLGESGTGKELVARAIHESGQRRSQPFVALNCAAIPESLIESELFGHEKGAFTDAISSKPGQFERADGGTLFLDEIAELSPATQSKLLRVLQEREIQRGRCRGSHRGRRPLGSRNQRRPRRRRERRALPA